MAIIPRPPAVGTAAFEPGTLTRGELNLAQHISGRVAAPVLLLCGMAPGPTLWVQAAIHGGEIGGSLALPRLLARLDPSQMTGSIVAVLAANPLAFRAQTRNSPEDGENMNRLFPGSPDASITRQMAHALMQAALATADVFIDLHSGGAEAIVPFYALYWTDETQASQQSARYARSAGVDIIWRASDSWLSGAMLTQMTRRGVPSVIIESGGGGAVSDQEIDSFATAVEGVARAMGILPGGAVAQSRYHIIGSCDLIFANAAGFFEPAPAAGDVDGKGSPLGRIVDVYGEEQARIVAPKNGFVAAIARSHLPVLAGALLAEINDDLGFEV